MNAPESKAQAASKPIQEQIIDCHDVMEQSLSKSRGIIFAMQQMREPEVEAPQLIEWALWAVSDFLFDAHEAMHKAQELERGAQ